MSNVVYFDDARLRVSIAADLEMAASCLAKAARTLCAAGLPVDPILIDVLNEAPAFFETQAALIEAPVHEGASA